MPSRCSCFKAGQNRISPFQKPPYMLKHVSLVQLILQLLKSCTPVSNSAMPKFGGLGLFKAKENAISSAN
jgi:hypothetical protein